MVSGSRLRFEYLSFRQALGQSRATSAASVSRYTWSYLFIRPSLGAGKGESLGAGKGKHIALPSWLACRLAVMLLVELAAPIMGHGGIAMFMVEPIG